MAEVLLGIALVGGAAATANAIAGRRARHAHAKSEAWALELAHDREGGAGLVWHSINRAVDDVLAHRRAASALAQLEGEAAHALEDAAQRLAIEDERAVVDERVRAAFDGAPW